MWARMSEKDVLSFTCLMWIHGFWNGVFLRKSFTSASVCLRKSLSCLSAMIRMMPPQPQTLMLKCSPPRGWYQEMGSLGGDEVVRVEPSWTGLVPFEEMPQGPLLLCHLKTVRWWPFLNQEGALTRQQICQHPDLGLPSLQDCKKSMFVVYKPPHLCICVMQPEWPKTDGWQACWFYVASSVYFLLSGSLSSSLSEMWLSLFLSLLFPPHYSLCIWRKHEFKPVSTLIKWKLGQGAQCPSSPNAHGASPTCLFLSPLLSFSLSSRSLPFSFSPLSVPLFFILSDYP